MVARGPHVAQKQPPSGPARKAKKKQENYVVLQKFLITFNAKLWVALQHSTHNTAHCWHVCVEVVAVAVLWCEL